MSRRGRLASRLFTLGSFLSLALCVGTAALWAWSYWRAETFTLWRMGPPMQAPGNEEVSAKAARGLLTVGRSWHVYAADEYAPHWWPRVGQGWESIYWGTTYAALPDYDPAPPDWLYSRPVLGFRVADLPGGTPAKPSRVCGVVVPLWFPLAAFAACPLWWAHRRRKLRRRLDRRLCPACGYDLRASPERCPECGTPALRGGTDVSRPARGEATNDRSRIAT